MAVSLVVYELSNYFDVIKEISAYLVFVFPYCRQKRVGRTFIFISEQE